MKRSRFMKEPVKNENVFGEGKFTRVLAVVNILIALEISAATEKIGPGFTPDARSFSSRRTMNK